MTLHGFSSENLDDRRGRDVSHLPHQLLKRRALRKDALLSRTGLHRKPRARYHTQADQQTGPNNQRIIRSTTRAWKPRPTQAFLRRCSMHVSGGLCLAQSNHPAASSTSSGLPVKEALVWFRVVRDTNHASGSFSDLQLAHQRQVPHCKFSSLAKPLHSWRSTGSLKWKREM